MEWFIFKSVAILAILLIFYKLLLEKENMHIFKRFYLLFAVIASVGIPLITITTYVEPVPGNFEPTLFTFSEEASVAENRSFIDYLPFILWTIYAMGVIFFSLNFIRNLRELLLKIKTNPNVKKGGSTRILLREKIDPHTFFSYIFLNRKKYEQEQIPKEVIIHEEAHAQQKHSLDVLFLELFQIIFWMNPLIILLKDAVKLNHEFLADKAVIKEGIQTAGYQYTLLSFSTGHLQSDLVNPINYSSIKKRFKVMKTQTSKSTIWTRGLLILPLISLLFFSFSNKEIVEKDISALPEESSNPHTLMLEVNESGKVFFQKDQTEIVELQKYISNGSYSSYHIEVAENSSPSIIQDLIQLMTENKLEGSVATCTSKETQQEKATPEMIAEYNRIIRDLNETGMIKQRDLNRIKIILQAMTAQQKKNSVQPKYKIASTKEVENDKQGKKNQKKATAEMIAEHDRLVKFYNSIPEEEFKMKQEDANRIMFIRSLMTKDQKNKAEKIRFEILPPPPPKPQTPPSPPTFEKLLADGAIFYYKGKTIEPQKARELVEDQKKVNVEITYKNQERPIVNLTDKRIN